MTTTINASNSGGGGLVQTADASGILALQTAGTTAVTIDASQNVGVGTASPAAKFQTNSTDGTVAIFRTTSGANNGRLTIDVSDAAATAGFSIGGNSSFPAMTFANGGTERMRIDSSGNVGIGTSSPTYGTLEVAQGSAGVVSVINNTAGAWAYRKVRSDGSNGMGLYDATGFGVMALYAAGSERMRIDSSGAVFVGGTGPIVYSKLLSQFDGASNYGIVANDTSNGNNVGFMAFAINGNSTSGSIGTILRNGTANSVLYNTTSDQRLKENITEADAALGIVEKIKVRKYDWIEGKQHEDHGFIAQELAEAVNGVVSKGKTEDDMWAVDYGKLTPLLCKAIQEQQALITSLTARIAALEGTPA